MNNFGIVVIGYNRANSLKRLLKAIAGADYKNDEILLIISIDHGGADDVGQAATDFEWKYGKKIIRTYDRNLGLRKHVLKCGSYLEEYDLDAVAVFEDDVIPSPAFYNFARQAVPFYQNNKAIAGISLYTHLLNVNRKLPFQPAYGNSDIYFSEFAQSWGQIWLREQWKAFENWYLQLPEGKCPTDGLPDNVAHWPESSWLKYHISYCVQMKRYFVYPYEALATCYTDAGEHSNAHITLFQVPMTYDSQKHYCFSDLDKKAVIYDSFFEREGMGQYLGIDESELCVDLYGTKCNVKQRYWLTTRKYRFGCIKNFALELRPHEMNVFQNEAGNEIFLYDTYNIRGRKVQKKSIGKNCEHLDYYFRLAIRGRRLIVFAIKQRIYDFRNRK